MVIGERPLRSPFLFVEIRARRQHDDRGNNQQDREHRFFHASTVLTDRREFKPCRLPANQYTPRVLIDYHMHTRLTDGAGEPVDYARVAIARGLDEIGCSDHAPLRDKETNWTQKKSDLPV